MVIKGVGNTTIPKGAERAGGLRSGFGVAAGPSVQAPAKMAATPALDGLLLLQETTDAPTRDRRARQHGRALLEALARLQLGWLADGGADPGARTLRELAGLAEACPEAADPALQSALAAIVLRAQVELARQGL